MSQSESERRTAEDKGSSKAEAAAGRRRLSDAELKTIAAAGDDIPSKGGGTSGKKKGP